LKRRIYFKKSAFEVHNINEDELRNSPTQKEVLENFFSELGTEYRFQDGILVLMFLL